MKQVGQTLEAPSRNIDTEISQVEEQILKLQAEIKELEAAEHRETKVSRRNLIKMLAAAGAAGILTKSFEKIPGIKRESHPLPDKNKTPENKKFAPEAEVRKAPESEVEKSAEIIKNERFAEVIYHPCLVSALYYSDEAIKKFESADQNKIEAEILKIYPLVSKDFREKYIKYLDQVVEEESRQGNLNMEKEILPLAQINYGNPKENHPDAIDLFIEEGAPIRSMAGGIVLLAENGWTKQDMTCTSSVRGGNTVIIFNPADNSFYRYAHMREADVRPGAVVASGTVIGTVGHTGINASKEGHGKHLHLEINKYNKKKGTNEASSVYELIKILKRLRA